VAAAGVAIEGEGAGIQHVGGLAISYATATMHLAKVPTLMVVTATALLMAALLPISGALDRRFGARRSMRRAFGYGLGQCSPGSPLFGQAQLACSR